MKSIRKVLFFVALAGCFPAAFSALAVELQRAAERQQPQPLQPEPQRWPLVLSGLVIAAWVARRRLSHSP